MNTLYPTVTFFSLSFYFFSFFLTGWGILISQLRRSSTTSCILSTELPLMSTLWCSSLMWWISSSLCSASGLLGWVGMYLQCYSHASCRSRTSTVHIKCQNEEKGWLWSWRECLYQTGWFENFSNCRSPGTFTHNNLRSWRTVNNAKSMSDSWPDWFEAV